MGVLLDVRAVKIMLLRLYSTGEEAVDLRYYVSTGRRRRMLG